MQLLTREQFKSMVDIKEQVAYLEQVAKEVGYPHRLIEVRRMENPHFTYLAYFDYDEYNSVDGAKEIGNTFDNGDLTDYALSLNNLKGSDFYQKVFKD